MSNFLCVFFLLCAIGLTVAVVVVTSIHVWFALRFAANLRDRFFKSNKGAGGQASDDHNISDQGNSSTTAKLTYSQVVRYQGLYSANKGSWINKKFSRWILRTDSRRPSRLRDSQQQPDHSYSSAVILQNTKIGLSGHFAKADR